MKKSSLLKPTVVLVMGVLQFTALCASSRGAAGDVDLSFDPGSGINGPISAMVIQPDGKMIICGEFTMVRGLVRTNIARLNPDGSGDSSFISSVEPGLTAIALQSDGKILVTGERRITRLHANGTFDATFVSPLDSVELGDRIRVTAMEVQPDGRVLLAGGFYAEDGTNVHFGLTRLNTNGTIDSSFIPPTNLVYSCFALQSDGKIVISADVPLDDWNHSRIIRLNANGTIDNTFTNEIVSDGFADALASSIALQPDGKVLVGGRFTSVGGLERRGIARLNSNGTVDATFDPGTPGYQVIGSMAVQSDGKIVVAVENFSWFIARLNSNGNEDGGFVRRYGFVSKVALQSDGRIVGVSRSVHVDGINRFELARLNSDSTLDQSFDPGRTPFAGSELVLQPDGKVLVGTHATLISGTNRFAAERRHPNGIRDNGFFGLDLRWHQQLFVPDYVVSFDATIAQPDGKILVGGIADRQECDVEGGCYLVGTDFLARMNPDGTRDVTFNPPDTNAYASAIALQPDGKVVAAGRIQISGVDRAVVRLLANGAADSTFTPVPFNAFDVDVLVIQPDGKILMGGSFSNVLGQSRRGVARLNSNGSLDNTFATGAGVGGSVCTMALQPDGKVLIGGSFTNINGTARTNLARLHSNGTVDMTFNAWTDADKLVRALALQPDGNILITGNFITADGTLRPHIARLLGDSPFPTLGLSRTNSLLKISWPVSVLNLQLQESTNLALANGWSAVGATRSTNDSFISVTLPVTSNEKFFRLRLP